VNLTIIFSYLNRWREINFLLVVLVLFLKMVEEVGNFMPDLNMIFKTALAKTCINAGLPQDSWASKDKTD